MAPIKEWFVWQGKSLKKFTEMLYVSPFQKAVERKRRMVLNHSLAAPWLAKKDLKDKEER